MRLKLQSFGKKLKIKLKKLTFNQGTMAIETYLKNRELFESRYKPSQYFRQCYISEMKKGIRNFKLFFALYGHDRRIILSSNTYGVDRQKRFEVPFKKWIGTKIVIKDFNYSMFEKYPDSFYKLQKQLKENFNF